MKRSLKSEAFVLKKRNLLNKDKIVTLFTKELGKLVVFAHGVRKITSKRLASLETGNLIKVELYKKGDRFYLQEAIIISGFYKIKNTSQKHKYLYFSLFILDKILPELEKEDNIFKLLKLFLKNLSEKDFTGANMDEFLNNLLLDLGYIEKPQVQERLHKTIEQIIGEKLPPEML